jgi:hypothetical protein
MKKKIILMHFQVKNSGDMHLIYVNLEVPTIQVWNLD